MTSPLGFKARYDGIASILMGSITRNYWKMRPTNLRIGLVFKCFAVVFVTRFKLFVLVLGLCSFRLMLVMN